MYLSVISHLASFEKIVFVCSFFLKLLISDLSFLTILFSLFFSSLQKIIYMPCFLYSFGQPVSQSFL